MPFSGLFISMSERKNIDFPETRPTDLQTYREPILRKAAGDGDRRQAVCVKRPGVLRVRWQRLLTGRPFYFGVHCPGRASASGGNQKVHILKDVVNGTAN